MPQAFEYRYTRRARNRRELRHDGYVERYMNDRAAKGWELVAAHWDGSVGYGIHHMYWRRPLPPEVAGQPAHDGPEGAPLAPSPRRNSRSASTAAPNATTTLPTRQT